MGVFYATVMLAAYLLGPSENDLFEGIYSAAGGGERDSFVEDDAVKVH